MVETTFKTDTFNHNVTYSGDAAIDREVYHLVVMKPGTDILNPDKGCDINRHLYWFVDEVDLPTEEQNIKNQLEKYTNYQSAEVKLKVVKKNGKHLLCILISPSQNGDTMLITTNGLYSEYTKTEPFTPEMVTEMTSVTKNI